MSGAASSLPEKTVTVRKLALLCALAGLAWAVCPVGLSSEPAEKGVAPFDCSVLPDSSRKLKAASLAMLSKLRDQRRDAEAAREAIGPDVIDELFALLSNQEERLSKTLRELDAVRCPSSLQSPNEPQ
jgi:hypothetical protein